MNKVIKKSLSLTLAVLMVMSSWVFVAPNKAMAATNEYTIPSTLNANSGNKSPEAFNGKAYYGDSGSNVYEATNGYKNIIYSSKTTNFPDGYMDKFYTKSKVAAPNVSILAYDGINDAYTPLVLEIYPDGSHTQEIWYVSLSDQNNVMKMKENWHGIKHQGSWYQWPGSYITFTKDIPSYPEKTDARLTGFENSGNYKSSTPCFLWNRLYYTGSGNTTDFYEKITNVSQYTAAGSYRSWGSWHDENGKIGIKPAPTYYVVNYKPIYDVLVNNSKVLVDDLNKEYTFKDLYNLIWGHENDYYPETVNNYYKAVNELVSLNVNNLFSGVTDSNAESKVTTAASKIKSVYNEYVNAAKALKRRGAFVLNGNGGNIINPSNTFIVKDYGQEFGYTPNVGRIGYEYLGMYKTQKADSTDYTKPDYSKEVSLQSNTYMHNYQQWYAAWWLRNINVKFVNENNEVISELTKKYGSVLSQDEIPEGPKYENKPGNEATFKYIFDHWEIVDAKKYSSQTDDTQSEDTSLYGEGVTSTLYGDIVFAPQYSVLKNSYTVKFCDENGQDLLTNTYSYNDFVIQPANLEDYEDNTYTYTFKGWEESKYESEKKIVDVGTPSAASLTVSKVRHDTIYIPVFERTYKEYKVTFKSQDPAFKEISYTGHYNDTYTLKDLAESYTEAGYRYVFVKWNELTNTNSKIGKFSTNAIFEAEYNAIPAVYNILFIDYDGSQIPGNTEYSHGTAIDIPNATETYRDNDYEYTFDKFIDAKGEGVSVIADKDVTYTAQYTKEKLYTVSYFNGSEFLGYEKVVAGKPIPQYLGETPTKENDKYATDYVFQGFETDDADNIEDILMPAKDIKVDAKFIGTQVKYTITFISEDEIYSSNDYSYGEKVILPANPVKDSDETYNYDFRGWDKIVSETCQGNETYNAIYHRDYVYYTVNWYNDDGTTLIKTDKYIFNERLSAPSTDKYTSTIFTNVSVDKSVVFKEWQYLDGTSFKRGDRVNSNIDLKAKWEVTQKDCTVIFKNYDGKVLGKYVVAYGTKLSDIIAPDAYKPYTLSKHYVFDGWGENDDRILGDVTFVAQFKEEDHNYTFKETVIQPSFTKVGSALWVCDCEAQEIRTIPVLTDSVIPSANIVIKNNVWKDVEDASFDIQTPVSSSNYFAITTSDKGDVIDKYNPEGLIGSGVDTVSYLIWDKGGYVDPATIDSSAWSLAWSYDEVYQKAKESYTQDAQGNLSEKDQAELDAKMLKIQGNATGTLGQILPVDMTEGQDFVLVVKVVDKKGNTIYANTGVLCLDDTSPELNLTSDHADGSKYCLEVSISVTDDAEIKTVKLDNKEIEAESDGTYKVTEAGLHQIVAIDAAGNEAKANFEIVGKHNPKIVKKEATCTVDGSIKTICTVCGDVIKAEEVIEATKHNIQEKTIEANCNADAKTVKYCTVCGETIETVVIENSKLNHNWKENYRKNSDCTNKGMVEEICSLCGEKKTTALETDSTKHTWYPTVTVKATCITEGYKSRICKYCGTEEKFDIQPITEHVAGEWIVDVEPTCIDAGHKIAFCVNCKTTDVVAEETIPATGHKIVVTVVKPTKDTEGYTEYRCTKCDYLEIKDYTDKLNEYKVTFVVEESSKDIVKYEGETILADDVNIPDTSKASDNTYSYVFEGWFDENDNKINFPILVSSNKTVSAKYRKIYKNYEVVLLNENGTVFYKVGYNHFGDIVDLSSYKPVKENNEYNSYIFSGWKKKGADDSSKSVSVKIDTTENIVLVPVFETIANTYNVVFVYGNNTVIKSYKNVSAGSDVIFDGQLPTLENTNSIHYVFDGWIGADENGKVENVTSNVLVVAKFKEENHITLNAQVVQSVSCTQPEITKYKCICGYEFTRETIPALGHTWSTDAVNTADGKHGYVCKTCGEFKEDTTTYTVQFIDDDKQTVIKTIAFLKWGDIIELPSNPKKEDTILKAYTFIGWTDKDGNLVDVDLTITKDATYYASYSESEKYFDVVYAIDAEHILAKYKVKGGDYVEYGGEIPVNYNADVYGHREFDEWSEGGYTGTIDNITSNKYIVAKFVKYDHSNTVKDVKATCKNPGGKEYTCRICGFTYFEKTQNALEHKWNYVKTEKFKEYYQCSICGEEKVVELPDLSVVADILIVDNHNLPLEGATVIILDGNKQINTGTTISNGHVKLKVTEPKEYSIIVRYGRIEVAGSVIVNADGSTEVKDAVINIQDCSCPCHKVGAWGDIFRFFHKIIKLITGKYSCCPDPDRRYN